MNSKNKKGFLLGNQVINMVVAVLVIFVLLVLGFNLYGLFSGGQDVAKVESHMQEIIRIISGLENGESENYLLFSPKGWVLVNWPNMRLEHSTNAINMVNVENYKITDLPDVCEGACLCLCEVNDLSPLDGCNKNAVCEDVSQYSSVNVKYNYEFNGPKSNEWIKIESGKGLEISLNNNNLEIIANG